MLERDLDYAANALRRELEYNHSAKLVRDEIAYKVGSIASAERRHHYRTPDLTPFNLQRRSTIELAIPINGKPPFSF